MTFDAAMTLLAEPDKLRLTWSFEARQPDYVILKGGLVIGVHLDKIEHLDQVPQLILRLGFFTESLTPEVMKSYL